VIEFALALALLHAPGGGAIYVNPDSVVTLHGKKGEKNQHVTDAAKCVVVTVDGKFISVIETCDEVRKLLDGRD
jgi:hypothetical protein